MEEGLRSIKMHDRKAEVSVLLAIITALALLNGCATVSFRSAVRTGNVSQVEKHIEKGADVDTTLNLAIRTGNLQVVKLLIESGADVIKDRGAPLITAAAAGDIEIAKLLIKSGADVNMWNDWQSVEFILPATALIAASWNGHPEMAKFLIEVGADVHHRDASGETALDYALRWGEGPRKILETVIVLVQAGADGRRALDLVRGEYEPRRKFYLVDELAEILEEAGAPNALQLARSGDFSQIAEYLKNWRNISSAPSE